MMIVRVGRIDSSFRFSRMVVNRKGDYDVKLFRIGNRFIIVICFCSCGVLMGD